jgi:hypothetical protein
MLRVEYVVGDYPVHRGEVVAGHPLATLCPPPTVLKIEIGRGLHRGPRGIRPERAGADLPLHFNPMRVSFTLGVELPSLPPASGVMEVDLPDRLPARKCSFPCRCHNQPSRRREPEMSSRQHVFYTRWLDQQPNVR